MAYFRGNETQETRRQPAVKDGMYTPPAPEDYTEADYDDGFGDPEEEAEELSAEEKETVRKKRFRAFSRAGNVTAVIVGTLVILVLLAFLMNMVSFVLNDADRNFTLFQTRF